MPEQAPAAGEKLAEPPHETDEIILWLISVLAKALKTSPTAIEVRSELASLGLDSLQLMSLLGEAEDFLGCRLPEDAVSETTTIEELAALLSSHKRTG